MITANVFQRVFHIQLGDSLGTCFVLDWKDRQYLVTARHVVESLQGNAEVTIFHQGVWKTLQVDLVGHGENSVDVSVLAPSVQLGRADLPLPVSTEGIVFGQDLYFLGFPYGLRADVGAINREFPLPLVKKGVLSAMIDGDKGEKILLLDGHNNPGFSGGPVVFAKMGGPADQLIVAGVISAYRFEPKPVLMSGQITGLEVQENAGIVIAYDIAHALKLIEVNPIGIVISG
jgi:S1-C subfamily serine protease